MIVLPLLMAVAGCAWAQNEAPTENGASSSDEAPVSSKDSFGIVVNQTFTPGGMEFYRRFTDYWREKPDFEKYNLVIIERPSRRYGNAIFVVQDQQVVFSGSLPIKVNAISALSLDAVEKVYANIISQTLQMVGGGDPDMAKNGF
ncbi:MAG: hypothetical protein JOY60_08190 [Burkholderiaceae bacterium]|nr:hypothetical protein [Burkholderiaceae bacterium]